MVKVRPAVTHAAWEDEDDAERVVEAQSQTAGERPLWWGDEPEVNLIARELKLEDFQDVQDHRK